VIDIITLYTLVSYTNIILYNNALVLIENKTEISFIVMKSGDIIFLTQNSKVIPIYSYMYR